MLHNLQICENLYSLSLSLTWSQNLPWFQFKLSVRFKIVESILSRERRYDIVRTVWCENYTAVVGLLADD